MSRVINALANVVGVGILLVGGTLIYAGLTPWNIISQLSILLVALLCQVALGAVAGLILRSWRAVAFAPLAYGAGFLAFPALQGVGIIPGGIAGTDDNLARVASIADGNFPLAIVFLLALLCCLLALGAMMGTRAGIRLEKRLRYRARQRAEERTTHLGMRAAINVASHAR